MPDQDPTQRDYAQREQLQHEHAEHGHLHRDQRRRGREQRRQPSWIRRLVNLTAALAAVLLILTGGITLLTSMPLPGTVSPPSLPSLSITGLLSHGLTTYLVTGFVLGTMSIMLPHQLVLPVGGVFALSGIAAIVNLTTNFSVFLQLIGFAVAGGVPWSLRAGYDAIWYHANDNPEYDEDLNELTPGDQYEHRDRDHPRTGQGLAYLALQALADAATRKLGGPNPRNGAHRPRNPDNRIEPAEAEIVFEGAMNGVNEPGYDPAVHGNQPPGEEPARQRGQQDHTEQHRGIEIVDDADTDLAADDGDDDMPWEWTGDDEDTDADDQNPYL